VIIGDTSMTGFGEAYASQIENDVGVQVELNDFTIEGLRVEEVKEVLKTDESLRIELLELPNAVKNAEVVVMAPHIENSWCPDKQLDMGSCFILAPAKESCYPINGKPVTFSVWGTYVEGIWSEILSMRKGRDTILRATDIYNPTVGKWQNSDRFEPYFQCWDIWSDALRRSAEAHHIPFLSRYDAFNGMNHDEDPIASGFIDGDNMQPTALGNQITAELMAELGYEAVRVP
jgi:hypothetical protein